MLVAQFFQNFDAFNAMRSNFLDEDLKRLSDTLLVSRSISLATENFRVRFLEKQ